MCSRNTNISRGNVDVKICNQGIIINEEILNIFIDTEFTDFLNPQLISMGLVAVSGEW
jgi:hypothetical protein